MHSVTPTQILSSFNNTTDWYLQNCTYLYHSKMGGFWWLDQKFLFVYSKICSKQPLTFCIFRKRKKNNWFGNCNRKPVAIFSHLFKGKVIKSHIYVILCLIKHSKEKKKKAYKLLNLVVCILITVKVYRRVSYNYIFMLILVSMYLWLPALLWSHFWFPSNSHLNTSHPHEDSAQ